VLRCDWNRIDGVTVELVDAAAERGNHAHELSIVGQLQAVDAGRDQRSGSSRHTPAQFAGLCDVQSAESSVQCGNVKESAGKQKAV